MGILDDAIREHLDLKRKHGARETELREIEDEAFGATEQPDPFTAGELLNEMAPGATATEAGTGLAEPGDADAGNEEPTRLVEPPALRPDGEEAEAGDLDLGLPDEPLGPPEDAGPIPGQEELLGDEQIPGQEDLLDQGPSGDVLEVDEPTAPSESLQDLIAEEEPFPDDEAAPPPPETAERPGPSEPDPEALAEPDLPEPESSVPDPPPPPPESGPEPPGRARGRVDVPTQEHPPPGETGDIPAASETEFRPEPFEPDEELPIEEPPAAEESPSEATEAEAGGPALYDFETDEDPIAAGEPAPAVDDDFDALGPAEEEAPYLEEEEPFAEEPASGTESDSPSMGSGRQTFEEEEAEDLWFEKGPPQDFDFEE